ncbi:MAG: hypothetical protein H7839_19315 [Magnetococcus sp. YQC-5]
MDDSPKKEMSQIGTTSNQHGKEVWFDGGQHWRTSSMNKTLRTTRVSAVTLPLLFPI